MSFVALDMLILVFCWVMFRHYRTKTRCLYCGGEWSKHQEDCPVGGSGASL